MTETILLNLIRSWKERLENDHDVVRPTEIDVAEAVVYHSTFVQILKEMGRTIEGLRVTDPNFVKP